MRGFRRELIEFVGVDVGGARRRIRRREAHRGKLLQRSRRFGDEIAHFSDGVRARQSRAELISAVARAWTFTRCENRVLFLLERVVRDEERERLRILGFVR